MKINNRGETNMKSWSNLAKVVYKRTYARNDTGTLENFSDTVDRVIKGNIEPFIGTKFLEDNEADLLKKFMLERKAMPAGRGLWFSGAPSHKIIGGAALNNCWATTAESIENFVMAMDLLMLGGGVGMSVEHKFTSKLPKVKKDITIKHVVSNDADYIVPDLRQGWCELLQKVLESFFFTGKSFSYSTICLRGYGEPIKGFGGTASGPLPLVNAIEKISAILKLREGNHIRPIDAMDIVCCIGELVVAGNVRRSAIIILGDAWDKDYLKAKRWDIQSIPTQRAMANLSIVCEDIEDVHPLFWKTYEQGEPFGIVNRKNIQKFGRMGERSKDSAYLVNPCGESTLEDGEPCSLQEIFLPNLKNIDEFKTAARLMHRFGKRITIEKYHNPKNDEVIKRNRRIGTGITGCLQSNLFEANTLNEVYETIQKENRSYSKLLNINESIRTTVIKPSGTLSLLGECTPGIHPAYSKYFIRRVRFSANDQLIPILRAAGHNIQPVKKFDGSFDHNTLVVDFYCNTPDGTPCADTDYDTQKQLDTLLFSQKYWADQAVSVTVYYKKEEIQKIKDWLRDNLKNLKTISFLCHNDHGFEQAPLEAITKDDYEKMSSKVKEIDVQNIGNNKFDGSDLECEGGVCPIK